jgi:hypothetical protein
MNGGKLDHEPIWPVTEPVSKILTWVGEDGLLREPVPVPATRAQQFDDRIKTLTQERGKDYGHPADNFSHMDLFDRIIKDCPDAVIREGLRMIGVKVARLVQSPYHQDSIEDIAGYARCLAMCVDRIKSEKK